MTVPTSATIDLVSLRSEIAFVADDSFLFTASVAENIAYARPQASPREIELAAQRAQAESFIAELPQGYETRIGERGLTLSGGQRQRVAIARALLADPRILILDDATSSVDARTEAEIKAGLKEAMRGRTTFVIAHRLSTVSLADEVVVMDGGRIVDRGTHEELISALRLLRRDRRARPCRLGLFAARPGAARGDGEAMSEREEVRAEEEMAAEEAAYSPDPNRLRAILLLFAALWRLLRGHDQRARKVRWMIGLLRPYRGRIALMFAALLIETGAGLAPPLLAGLAIDAGIKAANVGALELIVAAFFAAALLNAVGTYAETYLVGWVGTRTLQDLRERLFSHIQSMSIGFFTRRSPGVLVSRITNDIEALNQLVTDGIVTIFSSTLSLVGVVVILLVLDVKLALITFLTFPLLAAASLVFRIVSAGAYRATRERIAAVTAYLQETLSGVRVVRSFGQEPRHKAVMADLNEKNRAADMKTVYLNAAYFPAVEMLATVGTAVILLYGGSQAIAGAIEVGVVVSFVTYLTTFFEPIQELSQFYTTYQEGMAALDKIFDLLDTKPEMADAPGAIDPGPLRGAIAMEGVSFALRRGGGERR